jgi:hypothetical protein
MTHSPYGPRCIECAGDLPTRMEFGLQFCSQACIQKAEDRKRVLAEQHAQLRAGRMGELTPTYGMGTPFSHNPSEEDSYEEDSY